MKLRFALIAFVSIAYALPARAVRLEPVSNRTAAPLPVVDIRDEKFKIVAHLFVMPGETMQLDSTEKPAGGAGYYEAMPGEDTVVFIPAKYSLPHLGGETCPCALHMDKIGWNRKGEVAIVKGLRPFLETSLSAKTAIVSDVKNPRIANGKLYFKLKGHGSGEYWVLTRYGQVIETGGPWGLWEMTVFLLVYVLPLAVSCLIAFLVVGAVRLLREDNHPDKSFLELMQMCFMNLPFWRKRSDEAEWEE
jgi:hypothetical protein